MTDTHTDRILPALTALMASVFERELRAVNRQTTATDIAGWDSISNIALLLEIEAHFGVRFTTADVSRLHNVGGLVDLISARS